MDFSLWTRTDFLAFDAQRSLVFQPTPAELAQQEADRKASMIASTNSVLSKYGMVITGNETDFAPLYTSFILGGPDFTLNPDMKEWLGDSVRLNEILAEKIASHNTLNDFCSFVMNNP